MTKTFKVGDRVRTTGASIHGVPEGTLGTIIGVDRTSASFPITVNFECKSGGGWPVSPFEIGRVGALAPQTAKVLSILRAKGSLTAVEAAAIAKVRSLTRRITDLREAGFSVLSETRRDTEGQRYVRYYLNENAKAA
jgi:hypothetical protein